MAITVRLTREQWEKLHACNDFTGLKGNNANVQRVLWGSTGTKNPEYSDIKYITELMVAPTVNTIPEKTLNAFLDHGEVKDAFTGSSQEAVTMIESLRQFGIDIDDVCADLLDKGVKAFDDAFKALTASIEKKAAELSSV